jgi:hypothetical protein
MSKAITVPKRAYMQIVARSNPTTRVVLHDR